MMIETALAGIAFYLNVARARGFIPFLPEQIFRCLDDVFAPAHRYCPSSLRYASPVSYILLGTLGRVKARTVSACHVHCIETGIPVYTGCTVVLLLKGGNRMAMTRSIETEFRFNAGRLSL